ncbi:unnamed protein product, partial [Closterium sp. NIES-65]
GLSYNQLTGSLPAWLGNLPHLQVLYTDGTNLTCPANTRSCSQTHYALLPNTSFCQYCASFCFACRQSTGPTSSNRSSNSNSSSSSNNSSSSRSSSSNSSSSSGSDSSSPAASGGGGGVPVGAIVGIAVAAVVVLLLLLAAVLLCFRQQTKRNLKGMGTSLAASHCTEFSLDEIQQMADKNHPNIVRLLGFAVGGDVRSKIEQVLIYEFVPNGDLDSFAVLMLVVVTGRPPLSEDAGDTKQIMPWASECLSSGDIGSLKHPTMDAPGDVLLRLTELAVSCTVERTASRPTMAHIADELQAVREEVAGKDELSAAVKVDEQVQEMKDAFGGVDLEAQLQLIGEDGSFITQHPV